jgi:hypothetical protein
MPSPSFRPVGRCIYCGSDGQPQGLTREHIFPFSFGGTSVLPKASCRACAAITRDFEQSCARAMFGKLRILFNLPTQHKRQRPAELPLDIEVDGQRETLMIPIADYPAVPVVFPVFPHPPGMICGASPNAVFWNAGTKQIMPNLPDNQDRLVRLRARVGKPFAFFLGFQTPIGPFVRMLAKIAHSNAVAEFGIDGFTHLLPPLILGKTEYLPHFVGGIDISDFALPVGFKDHTHVLYFWSGEGKITNKAGNTIYHKRYLGAAISLFKDMGPPPTYSVVIGEPTIDTWRRLTEFSFPGAPRQSGRTILFERPVD